MRRLALLACCALPPLAAPERPALGWWLGTTVGNQRAFPPEVFAATLRLLQQHADAADVLMPFVGLTAQPDGAIAPAPAVAAAAVRSWLDPIRAHASPLARVVPMLALGSNATAHAAYASPSYVGDAVALLRRHGWHGYSIDYEPPECRTQDPAEPPPCPQEPARLASFIRRLSAALHAAGATLSLCVDDRPYAHDFLKARHYRRYMAAGLDKVLQMGSCETPHQPPLRPQAPPMSSSSALSAGLAR